MGKPTGFLEFERRVAGEQAEAERIKHYKEFTGSLPVKDLQQQAARCMDCGIPFCHSAFGCPLVNLIPEWNDLAYNNLWREAWERLELTNNFPEITGRVCPAPCESACTLAINDSPVTIKQLELEIIERAFRQGWVVPQPPLRLSGKSVAVIGSGPAGLAAAQQLRRLGHEVTVFERSPKIGGLLRYGIPDFKLEKRILDRRLEQLGAEGVQFETNVEIGTDISARYLIKSFDALLLCLGAGQPRDLDVPGRELEGIHFAMDYLTRSNLYVDGQLSGDELIQAEGKNVLVIGGGDTGSDCVGTANRQGAEKVYQFEILSKPPEWPHSWNPNWPQWPAILRSSSSHREGCQRDWSILTKEFRGENGRVKSVSCARIEWFKDNKSGRMTFSEVEQSQFELEVDLVLLAMGFVHVERGKLLGQLQPKFDERGNIRIDQNYRTSVPAVFAAGDAGSGASLVVRAIHHGRQAAEAIDRFLKNGRQEENE